MKKIVGQEIAKRVKPGEIIGVGTGSTVDAALEQIAVSGKQADLAVVPSSYQTALKCQEMGFKVLSSLYDGEISWGFDGADEVDPQLRLIKGRGGAMLQEKILAKKCKRFVVIVDDSKIVQTLGQNHSIPIEVVPEALYPVLRGLEKLSVKEVVRREAVSKHGPVITERGNLILDASFDKIQDELEQQLKSIVGVVESGLFIGYTDEVLVAGQDGVRSMVLDSRGLTTRPLTSASELL